MDFNFFEPLRVVKKTNVIRLAIICLLLVASIGTAANMGMTYYQHRMVEAEVASLNRLMQDAQYQESLREVDELQRQLDDVAVKKAYLDAVEDHAIRSHTVSWKMMDTISQEVPVNLSLSNMSFKGSEIIMSGTGIDKMTIAQFEYNLRELGQFEDIVVSNISRQGDEGNTYSFNMTMFIKGAEAKEDTGDEEGDETESDSEEEVQDEG